VVIAVFGGLVLIVGPLAALAISGVGRYLGAAKSAEAKVTIGAISRAAVASYEREDPEAVLQDQRGPSHLCRSATPVPSTLALVRGMKYMPRQGGADFNADFQTGTSKEGWKCLRFALETPIAYRYNYLQGSGYLVPSIAPGPNGFEASAQGDINGDGDPSTFALTGTVGPKDRVVVSPQIYIEKEFE